jgi:chromosome partitioning protein
MGDVPIEAAIRPTSMEGLDLVGADLDLSGLEVELPQQSGWQGALRAVLEPLDGYDVAVIDTAPGLGILPYVSLVASTAALVVTPPEFLAYRALRLVEETVERARQERPGLRLLGIVPTFVTRQTRHAREVLEVLQDDFGGQVLPEIPRRVVLQDAALAGQPVRAYAPASAAAGAFAELAREVIARANSTS